MNKDIVRSKNHKDSNKQYKKELKRRYLESLNQPKPGDVLFCVEAVDYPEQEVPNSFARVGKCRTLNFVDSAYLKWNVYEDECGDVVVMATRLTTA